MARGRGANTLALQQLQQPPQPVPHAAHPPPPHLVRAHHLRVQLAACASCPRGRAGGRYGRAGARREGGSLVESRRRRGRCQERAPKEQRSCSSTTAEKAWSNYRALELPSASGHSESVKYGHNSEAGRSRMHRPRKNRIGIELRWNIT
eukprot:1195713-Prorocentrum_minimum.AAC.1